MRRDLYTTRRVLRDKTHGSRLQHCLLQIKTLAFYAETIDARHRSSKRNIILLLQFLLRNQFFYAISVYFQIYILENARLLA